MQRNPALSDYEIATVLAIRAIEAQKGVLASYNNIAEHLGVSKSTARYRVLRAISQGLVIQQPGKYRSIRLTAAASTVSEPKKKRRAA
jgi:Mn-dependent DtxR family transcriptional regulator